MSDKLTKLLATFFYIGDFPLGPGSLASIVGVLIYIALYQNPAIYVILILAVTFLGFMVSGRAEEILKQKDPSCIVIDEVAGVMVAFFMLPLTLPVVLTAFFLFRAFDMFKIYPVDKFEQMEGAKGVMIDDLFAGFYTCITMHIAIHLKSLIL